MPEAKPHVLDKEIKGSLPGDRGGDNKYPIRILQFFYRSQTHGKVSNKKMTEKDRAEVLTSLMMLS